QCACSIYTICLWLSVSNDCACQAYAIHEGMDGEPNNRHPTCNGPRRSPMLFRLAFAGTQLVMAMLMPTVLMVMLVFLMVVALAHIQFMTVWGDKSFDAEEADHTQRHPPAEVVLGVLHGIRHDVEKRCPKHHARGKTQVKLQSAM